MRPKLVLLDLLLLSGLLWVGILHMGSNGAPAKELVITPEAWTIMDTDHEFFRFLVDHEPPRPYGYLTQLKKDLQNWKCAAFWFTGVGILALAAATGLWILSLIGMWLIFRLSQLIYLTMRMFRDGHLLVGVIEKLRKRHPLGTDHALAHARMADGREVVVTVPIGLVAEWIEEFGGAEVLFPCCPNDQFSVVIGARAFSPTSRS